MIVHETATHEMKVELKPLQVPLCLHQWTSVHNIYVTEAVKDSEYKFWNYTWNKTINLIYCKNGEQITITDLLNNDNHWSIGSWLGREKLTRVH